MSLASPTMYAPARTAEPPPQEVDRVGDAVFPVADDEARIGDDGRGEERLGGTIAAQPLAATTFLCGRRPPYAPKPVIVVGADDAERLPRLVGGAAEETGRARDEEC